MSERTEIGWIEHAHFGSGGYQDAQFGLSLTFSGDGWGCGTFEGFWASKPSEYAKWSNEDRRNSFADTVEKLIKILEDARVKSVEKLAGAPVELTFEGNTLKDWRVLTEAIRK
jgi:hypothetical protein